MMTQFHSKEDALKAYAKEKAPKILVHSVHADNTGGNYFLETGDDISMIRNWETVIKEAHK